MGEDDQSMRIRGGPIFWLVIALLIFLFWKAPQPMAVLLGGLGHIFVVVGGALARALSTVTHKPA
jgi:hypothetical protein